MFFLAGYTILCSCYCYWAGFLNPLDDSYHNYCASLGTEDEWGFDFWVFEVMVVIMMVLFSPVMAPMSLFWSSVRKLRKTFKERTKR